jgi:predicted dehydrogenase
LRTSERNQLIAVASRRADKGRDYADEWGIDMAYSSYEDMLADPEVHVVYNSLPNGLHAEWTIKAAQAGKHVLCEKPMTVTVAEADAVIEAVEQNHVVVAEAFMYRHHPQTLKVKELIEAGKIGEVKLVRSSFTFTISNQPNVRLNPDLAGGSIWDVGCYPINYARFVVGAAPARVIGHQFVGAGSGVDESFFGTIEFANGAVAQFDCGFRAPYRAHLEIVGSEGIVVVPRPFKPLAKDTILIGKASDQLEPLEVEGLEQLYIGEVEDMADAVLLGKAPRISLADSRGNVATIVALLQSAREGRPIAIS